MDATWIKIVIVAVIIAALIFWSAVRMAKRSGAISDLSEEEWRDVD